MITKENMAKSLTQLLEEAYIDDNEDVLDDILLMAHNNPQIVASHYYFHVGESVNYYSKQQEINITITPKVYFDTHHFLYDQYMEPIEIILDDEASEISSSSYTMNYPSSIAQVEQLLLSKGFIKDSTFDSFLNKTP